MSITTFSAMRRAAMPAVRKVDVDKRRSARHRGYDWEWEQFARDYRERNPLCVMCLEEGYTTPATCVDHKRKLRDHPELKYEPSNLQALCDPHHGSKTRGGQ